MNYTTPMQIANSHTIENCLGKKIIFLSLGQEPDCEKLIVENFVTPGPIRHTHLLQDEALTVVKGKIAYQIPGQPIEYAQAGESVLFKWGVPHRFWNAGEEMLACKRRIKPVHTIVFFLSAIFAAHNKSGKAKPEAFDGTYLMRRYRRDYDLVEIPKLVKTADLPPGLLGKYIHSKDAPPPLKP